METGHVIFVHAQLICFVGGPDTHSQGELGRVFKRVYVFPKLFSPFHNFRVANGRWGILRMVLVVFAQVVRCNAMNQQKVSIIHPAIHGRRSRPHLKLFLGDGVKIKIFNEIEAVIFEKFFCLVPNLRNILTNI